MKDLKTVKSNRIFAIISVLFLFVSFYFNLSFNFSDYGDNNFDSWSNGIMLADMNYNEHFKSDSSFAKIIIPGTTMSDGANIKSGDDLYIAYVNHVPYTAKDYVDYNSNVVAHRFFYHFMDKILPFSNYIKIEILYMMNALLMAVSVSIIFLWIKKITNTVSATVTLGLIGLFAPNFCMYGKNLYWVGWSLFLPMAASVLILKYRKFGTGKRRWILPLVVAFGTCFIKQVFYYEFISSVMIAMMVPYVYDCVEKKYSLKQSIKLMVSPTVGAILSFGAVSFTKILMLAHDTGSFTQAINDFFGPISYRILGNSSMQGAGIAESAKASVFSVFKLMLLKPALSVKSTFFIADIVVIFVLCVITFAAIYFERTRKFNRTHFNACLAAAWVSLLAPLSWFILAKPHSYLHNHHCSILWFLPFVPIALTIIIYCIARLSDKYLYGCSKNRKLLETWSIKQKIVACIVTAVILGGGLITFVNRNAANVAQINNIVVNATPIYSDSENGTVYYQDGAFYYVKSRGADTKSYVFLHVIPKDVQALSESAQRDGFQNLDFPWKDKEIKVPFWCEKRMARVEIHVDYPAQKIETGQFNLKTMQQLWKIEISPDSYLKIPAQIIPANLTDANWTNGIKKDGTTILLQGTKPEYSMLQGKTLILSNNTILSVNQIKIEGDWTHLILSGKVHASQGYPQKIQVK